MAVLATDTITLAVAVDVQQVDAYYRLQSSTAAPPAKPTEASPAGWTATEPTYDGTSTNTLYTCAKTTLTDGTFYWSAVSKSTSYEAAKAAWNKAGAAESAAAATSAYFWHDSGGAHVATTENDITQGYSTTIGATEGTTGILLQKDAKNLASFTPEALNFYRHVDGDAQTTASFNENGAVIYDEDGGVSSAFTKGSASFYDGQGVGADNLVACFGAGVAQIGQSSDQHVVVDPGGMCIFGPDGEGMPSLYFTATADGIVMENPDSDIMQVLSSTRNSFKTNAGDIAWFGQGDDGVWEMHIGTTYAEDMVRFGDYAWIKRHNGNMTIKWMGE